MISINVLVVDDNVLSALLITCILKDYPEILLVKAFSGNEAIKLTQDMDFNIIFMDISMPVMDGIETTKIIKKKSKIRANSDYFYYRIHH